MNQIREWLTLEEQREAILMRVTLEHTEPVAFTLTPQEALDLGEAIVKMVRSIGAQASYLGDRR